MRRRRRSSPKALAVLAALLDAAPPAWRHGYDLMSSADVASGTLYPLLMRFSERGLLESEWRASEITGRPARHCYRLTGAGRIYATEQLRQAHMSATLEALA